MVPCRVHVSVCDLHINFMVKAEQRTSMHTKPPSKPMARYTQNTHDCLTNLCTENFTLTTVYGCARIEVFFPLRQVLPFLPYSRAVQKFMFSILNSYNYYATLHGIVFDSKQEKPRTNTLPNCGHRCSEKKKSMNTKTFCISYYHTSV